VTDHATPVGSGTVARTKRIRVERRAEAAVIAWLRHQTTGYDGMVIPRVKGKRREVRRLLARRSQELLGRYRRGEPASEGCPLRKALKDGEALGAIAVLLAVLGPVCSVRSASGRRSRPGRGPRSSVHF
jgi:hypothetical protein